MPSFVDESGTPSRRFPLPDLYLVVGCVTVPDEIVVIDLLRDFRLQKGWSAKREIKFTNLDHEQRLEFLALVRKSEIRVDAAIIDKRTIKTPVQSLKPGELYKRSVALAIAYSVRDFSTNHVTIDQYFNSKPENRNFVSYLRQTINGGCSHEKRVSDFSVEDSNRIPGLQVVDVVAGAIARRYTDGDNVYRSVLAVVC